MQLGGQRWKSKSPTGFYLLTSKFELRPINVESINSKDLSFKELFRNWVILLHPCLETLSIPSTLSSRLTALDLLPSINPVHYKKFTKALKNPLNCTLQTKQIPLLIAAQILSSWKVSPLRFGSEDRRAGNLRWQRDPWFKCNTGNFYLRVTHNAVGVRQC